MPLQSTKQTRKPELKPAQRRMRRVNTTPTGPHMVDILDVVERMRQEFPDVEIILTDVRSLEGSVEVRGAGVGKANTVHQRGKRLLLAAQIINALIVTGERKQKRQWWKWLLE